MNELDQTIEQLRIMAREGCSIDEMIRFLDGPEKNGFFYVMTCLRGAFQVPVRELVYLQCHEAFSQCGWDEGQFDRILRDILANEANWGG